MVSEMEQMITDFLAETNELFAQLEVLPYSTASELYELLETTAQTAIMQRKHVDPELRVEICARQDVLLERIVDTKPLEEMLSNKPLGIFTPAVHEYRRWSNTELLKDKCLTGYLLAQLFGAKPVQYFCNNDESYPYIQELPGLEVLYHDAPRGTKEVYFQHLTEAYPEMDVLILHGMYLQTLDYLDAYRCLRPDGKVYCGLDMNSSWMENINWDYRGVHQFAAQCDVVATSCSSLRDALNRNPETNFACHWLPNGFYNAGNLAVVADPDVKKNVILTVGRIGTEQKNNAELLISFARASAILEGWTLRLVGTVEKEFEPVIEQFFKKRPDLRERVIFTGPIMDKAELYAEYAKANIFVLTSLFEGGTPNVYAEALAHGCRFVTSNIDAADDITNHGALGITYHHGEYDALALAFVKLAQESGREATRRHIQQTQAYARKHFDWNRNAKKLAYMLYRV